MRNTICLLFLTLLLVSCTDNAFEEILFRTTDDPFDDVPVSDSLALEHTVYLSWKPDDACDVFCLMRSYDQKTLSFSCVYSGSQTSYADTDLTDNNRYVYRLDKIRGKKYFTGSEYAFGYSSDCRRDSSEPNDTEGEATVLEYDLICNLPCVRYITGNRQSIDEDWFCITIPPHRATEIVISQHNLSNESAGAATNLKVQVAGSESEAVKQKVAKVINNTSFETRQFFFKVFPETTGLFPADSNTAVIEYTVSLSKIYNYSL